VLVSVKEQLQSGKPMSKEELERLKKLSRFVDNDRESHEPVSWTSVFRSARKPQPSDGEAGLSKWDRQDLETLQKEMSSSR